MIDADFKAQIFSEPWAILPAALSSLIQRVSEIDPAQRADDEVGVKIWGQLIYPQVEVIGNVAVVPVNGAIGRRCGWWEQMCGMADSAIFQEQMRNVRDDPQVEIVVVHLNTPGGVAYGLEEAVGTIAEVSAAGKPVIAYTDKMCASAGYYLAAGCDAIYADPAAVVGSISTIMAGVDSSKRWEEEGLELKLFVSGNLKAAGMPGKKWAEEEEKYFRERLEAVDGPFKDFIRQRRALSDDQMQGQVWQAKEVAGELVDGFAETLPLLVAELLSSEQ